MVLLRLSGQAPFKSVSIEDIKSTLKDAGVNLAAIHFTGARHCTVNRVDVEYDEAKALEQWIKARQGERAPSAPPSTAPSSDSMALATDANMATMARVEPVALEEQVAEDPASLTLRSQLACGLAERLKLPREALQMTFRSSDEKVLNLSEPQFKFQIDATRARNLGDISWNVTIVNGESKQKVTVSATAKAWQTQLVAARSISHKQMIRPEDVLERRTLIERIGSEPMLRVDQAVGQQAAHEIKAGTILTAKSIDPVPLVRAGQFVTITLAQGGVQVKTVARALEGGAYGQSVRVRNETTRETFQVVINGPQTAVIGPASTPVSEP
jgi:flagella basal body P-ring formation protein FlgA